MRKRKEPKSNKPRHNHKQEGERGAPGRQKRTGVEYAAITAKNSNSAA